MRAAWLLGLALASSAFSSPVISNGRWITVAHYGIDPSSFPPCAQESYLGAYGHPLQHVFSLQHHECLSDVQANRISYVERRSKPFTLFWLQDSGVDPSMYHGSRVPEDRIHDSFLHIRNRVKTELAFVALRDGSQYPIGPTDPNDGVRLEWSSNTGGVISVDNDIVGYLDMLTPPYISAVAIPSPFGARSFVPVPPSSIKHMHALIKGLRFNPDVASILSSLSIADMTSDIRHLTGEDGGGILSRHSFSPGALVAADWIQGNLEGTGAKCRKRPFLPGFAPNVICRYEGTGNDTSFVLLSAHYDSRGTYGNIRAPGANDDGSGVTHLLAIAKAIKAHRIKFNSPVELVAFAGEEQGLIGSQAYARELRDRGENITLMIQADMLAYHSPAEPLQLGLPEYIGLPEAGWFLSNVSKIYSPELTVGLTAACCSDHQSFVSEGYPATQVYERAGRIIDPMYHNSGDLSQREGYDLQQVRSITKVTFASVLEAAGFTISPLEGE